MHTPSVTASFVMVDFSAFVPDISWIVLVKVFYIAGVSKTEATDYEY